jgi:3-hydroxyacyl-CoA dehydrogenase/enoyl-CoA hydratase/3-hydroxybutyryl-CoA epimerase
MIDYSVDADGIASISWNMTNYPMNVMNAASIAAFAETIERAINDASVKGAIITSAKRDFIAGADLKIILKLKNADAVADFVGTLQKVMRRIETSGKPFVAAINGTALGGGYETCLACHHRIAADDPKTLIGLPEVSIGLFPAGGGTQRLPRLIGVRAALPFLLEGKKVDPRRALENGLVDQVVPANELLAQAKTWLLTEGPSNTVRPWDRKGFKLPGGAVQSPQGYETFTAGNAMLMEKTFGNYPAPLAIMSCVYEGCQTDIDNGMKIEIRYFVKVCLSTEAKNMMRTQFFAIGEANKLASRPKDVPASAYRKAGVLGAGMMGAGIAYACAEAGLQVVLLDVSLEAAQKGKAYSAALLDKKMAAKRISEDERDSKLALIHTTADFGDLAGCDIIIEAVFEDRAVKAEVMKKAEAVIASSTVFASNTSTLPITELAHASNRPENVIGLHFFSPVEKMPLLEIIRGKRTSDECLAKSMDFAKKIRKTPIVVNDSRGFYTSRVVLAYMGEGLAMLAEGVNPALIENAGRHAGMPVGPLALADEVSIELMQSIRKQAAIDLGKDYQPGPIDKVGNMMVDQLGRIGKKAGKGFYDYPVDGRKRLWPGLAQAFPLAAAQPDPADVKRRLLYLQSAETARCLDEGVLRTAQDADVGAILGWGFPAYLGGPISQIHSIGVARFVDECEALVARHGARFAAPGLLKDMAAKGEDFYDA